MEQRDKLEMYATAYTYSLYSLDFDRANSK